MTRKATTIGVLIVLTGPALCAADVGAGIRIRANPLVLPSVRRERIEVRLLIDNLQDKPRRVSVAVRIANWKTGEEACAPRRAMVSLPRGFSGEKSVVFPVKDLMCWSPENPQQYYCDFEIREGGELRLDIPRVKFGYRELWAEDGRLCLNGRKLFAAGKSHNYLKGYGFVRGELELLRESGQMADRTGRPPDDEQFATLDVTDEFGWLVFMCEVPMGDEGRELLYKIGNHPSVISWTQWGNGYVNGPHGHPMQIGGVVPKSVQRSDEIYERMRECKRIDPSRTNGYYRLGAGGEYRGIMSDLGFGAPLQTMEEWLSYWAEHKPAPFLPMEFALMRIHEYSLWQRRSGECGLVEQCARYFGEDAYRRLPDDVLAEAYAPGATNIDVTGAVKYSDLLFDLKDLCYTRAVRAWRTYGISGYLLHVDGKRDFTHTEGVVNRWGETLAKVSAPVCLYIGGPEEDFVSKDHAFFAGEAIRKSVILINDSPGEIPGIVEWELREAGGDLLASGSHTGPVKQGEVLFVPIRYTAPQVTEKTSLVLSARYGNGEQEAHRDRFEMQVFPRSEVGWTGEPVLLIDSHGDTGAMLDGLGVPYEPVSADVDLGTIEGARLLVIGRNSYGEAAEVFRRHSQIERAIRSGLNVICLEQMNRRVMGSTVENFNTREAFIRAKDSPLLERLDDDDFRNWRGESSLLPAYPPWNPESDWRAENDGKHGQRNVFGQRRYWHWSNKGMVATFCFEKPQVGNFRVLLDNGFDLLYTPLVEFRQGEGRVLVSQLDLVDHWESDPAARLVLTRMLTEYSRPGAEATGTVRCLRDDAIGEAFGVPTLEAREAKAFVEDGGTLVACVRSQDEARMLPVDVGIQMRSVRRGQFPDDPVFSGLGMSELFWREATEVPAITRLGGTDPKIGVGGIAGVTRLGNGNVVLLQIDPTLFSDDTHAWQRSKVLRIYSTVLGNLGLSRSARLDLTAIAGRGEVNDWLPGYAPGEGAEQADTESDLYAVEALDFDPDEHHVW